LPSFATIAALADRVDVPPVWPALVLPCAPVLLLALVSLLVLVLLLAPGVVPLLGEPPDPPPQASSPNATTARAIHRWEEKFIGEVLKNSSSDCTGSTNRACTALPRRFDTHVSALQRVGGFDM
jgi:hypothetical protein